MLPGNPYSANWDCRMIEVVSKPWIRLEGKAPAEKMRSPPQADEHFKEACNAAIGP